MESAQPPNPNNRLDSFSVSIKSVELRPELRAETGLSLGFSWETIIMAPYGSGKHYFCIFRFHITEIKWLDF